ncbi:MAG TPA: hypothetical protein PKY64_09735, partial [Anaerolineaceae bacterium]|nr:hypothetical protein [Anaerolineaceae bacterium]
GELGSTGNYIIQKPWCASNPPTHIEIQYWRVEGTTRLIIKPLPVPPTSPYDFTHPHIKVSPHSS